MTLAEGGVREDTRPKLMVVTHPHPLPSETVLGKTRQTSMFASIHIGSKTPPTSVALGHCLCYYRFDPG